MGMGDAFLTRGFCGKYEEIVLGRAYAAIRSRASIDAFVGPSKSG